MLLLLLLLILTGDIGNGHRVKDVQRVALRLVLLLQVLLPSQAVRLEEQRVGGGIAAQGLRAINVEAIDAEAAEQQLLLMCLCFSCCCDSRTGGGGC